MEMKFTFQKNQYPKQLSFLIETLIGIAQYIYINLGPIRGNPFTYKWISYEILLKRYKNLFLKQNIFILLKRIDHQIKIL